jgi:3-oxoacyl-[acyl-carrier protein] reductase
MMNQRKYIFAGANSAIAKATAEKLRTQGHHIIGISRTDVSSYYDDSYTVNDYCDKTTYPQIEGAVNGLVYFPGSIKLKPFARISAEEYLDDFRIHALGAAMFTQHFIPNLKTGDAPSIVFISSVAARTGLTFHTSVSMAKGALESLALSLAAELSPLVRVNAVSLSLTDTPLASSLLNTDQKREASALRHPLKKIGSADDAAESISFLLGSSASWITGNVINLDGGMKSLRV